VLLGQATNFLAFSDRLSLHLQEDWTGRSGICARRWSEFCGAARWHMAALYRQAGRQVRHRELDRTCVASSGDGNRQRREPPRGTFSSDTGCCTVNPPAQAQWSTGSRN